MPVLNFQALGYPALTTVSEQHCPMAFSHSSIRSTFSILLYSRTSTSRNSLIRELFRINRQPIMTDPKAYFQS